MRQLIPVPKVKAYITWLLHWFSRHNGGLSSTISRKTLSFIYQPATSIHISYRPSDVGRTFWQRMAWRYQQGRLCPSAYLKCLLPLKRSDQVTLFRSSGYDISGVWTFNGLLIILINHKRYCARQMQSFSSKTPHRSFSDDLVLKSSHAPSRQQFYKVALLALK